jgi:hypothetical protein
MKCIKKEPLKNTTTELAYESTWLRYELINYFTLFTFKNIFVNFLQNINKFIRIIFLNKDSHLNNEQILPFFKVMFINYL